MLSSGMFHRVTLIRTDVSEERSAYIRVTKIGELRTTLAVTNERLLLVTANVVFSSLILVNLMMEALPPKHRFLQEPCG
jgi:hypothetical protein